ncbi:MAG: aminotransferase class V-fold PLP-dependent enzyme [bacterium]|nr:aminotransferase class V-fold PLP-dependent enzyme [bacterium]
MILLNPGPVNVSPRVTAALGRGDLCHREPECAALLGAVREKLLRAFAPAGGFAATLVTGSGTAAVETAVSSVCSPKGRLVVVANGVYGERMARMAEAQRIAHTVVEGPWTSPPDLGAVETALRAPDVEAVAVVHHETTTGLRTPVGEVGRLARRYGKLCLVDAVSGLGGDPLDLEADGVDVVVGTSGKCVQAFPGIGVVLVRDAVLERLVAYPPRSLYLSLATYARTPMPFTPAVQVAYALDEALDELLDETVAGRQARYAAAAGIVRNGCEGLGLEIVLPPALRSNTITSLRLPPGVTYAALHDGLKARGFVIYEGQGWFAREAFRVANMGALAAADFERFVGALGEVLAGARRSG